MQTRLECFIEQVGRGVQHGDGSASHVQFHHESKELLWDPKVQTRKMLTMHDKCCCQSNGPAANVHYRMLVAP
jgi:hypothetical protein